VTIRIPEKPGVCRICRCTEFDPCEGGCGWANAMQTLCTACVDVDKALRTIDGRRELRDALYEHERARAIALARLAGHVKRPRPKQRRRSS
jgi:hypothetical protein